MITEQDVRSVVLKVLKDHEKISYTQDGLDFLLKEVRKLLPQGEFIVSSQPLEGMSAQDRAERKAPTITVDFIEKVNEKEMPD